MKDFRNRSNNVILRGLGEVYRVALVLLLTVSLIFSTSPLSKVYAAELDSPVETQEEKDSPGTPSAEEEDDENGGGNIEGENTGGDEGGNTGEEGGNTGDEGGNTGDEGGNTGGDEGGNTGDEGGNTDDENDGKKENEDESGNGGETGGDSEGDDVTDKDEEKDSENKEDNKEEDGKATEDHKTDNKETENKEETDPAEEEEEPSEEDGNKEEEPAKDQEANETQEAAKKETDADTGREEEPTLKETAQKQAETIAKAPAKQAVAVIPRANGDTSVLQADGNGLSYTIDYRAIWEERLTPAERMRSKMIKVDKVPALANVTNYLYVRMGPGVKYKAVGKLSQLGIVYILNDDDTWVYVESGDVRGYVRKDLLLRGERAEKYLEKKDEEDLPLAKELVKPEDNTAFSDFLVTVYDIPSVSRYLKVARASSVIAYAEKFLGRPYVWGGTDMWNGSDCSGFMQSLFATFGIALPRTAHQQSLYLQGVSKEDARAGDLLFFADASAHVYHVGMYLGEGMMLHAANRRAGVIESGVNLSSIYKIGRVFNDEGEYTSTQALTLVETGQLAYAGDSGAKAEIIEYLADASERASDRYGFPSSVIIAQTILESGWLSFAGAGHGGMQPEDNNVMGMNAELLNSLWESPWTGEIVSRNVPQYVNGRNVYGYETMRAYEDIESCLEDYAAFKIGLHPELAFETDIDKVIDVGLEGYATDPAYKDKIRNIIYAYNLMRFD